jgi:F420-dependent methylenetetrahydromethanopterin dehydrogenase
MNVFVERRAGVVMGVYAMRQPGYAEEELADDHPDIVAYVAPKPAPPTPATAEQLLKALAKKGVITRADVDAERA